MSDYYYESWFDQHFGKILVGFFLFFFIIVVAAVSFHSTKVSVLYDDCLKDGKKEYECYALIYGGGRR